MLGRDSGEVGVGRLSVGVEMLTAGEDKCCVEGEKEVGGIDVGGAAKFGGLFIWGVNGGGWW